MIVFLTHRFGDPRAFLKKKLRWPKLSTNVEVGESSTSSAFYIFSIVSDTVIDFHIRTIKQSLIKT